MVQISLNYYLQLVSPHLVADLRRIDSQLTELRRQHYISLICNEEEEMLVALEFDIGFIDVKNQAFVFAKEIFSTKFFTNPATAVGTN